MTQSWALFTPHRGSCLHPTSLKRQTGEMRDWKELWKMINQDEENTMMAILLYKKSKERIIHLNTNNNLRYCSLKAQSLTSFDILFPVHHQVIFSLPLHPFPLIDVHVRALGLSCMRTKNSANTSTADWARWQDSLFQTANLTRPRPNLCN